MKNLLVCKLKGESATQYVVDFFSNRFQEGLRISDCRCRKKLERWFIVSHIVIKAALGLLVGGDKLSDRDKKVARVLKRWIVKKTPKRQDSECWFSDLNGSWGRPDYPKGGEQSPNYYSWPS